MQPYRFPIAQTPREVPAAIARQVTFGDTLTWVGSLLALIGGCLLAVFAPLTGARRAVQLLGDTETTTAVVLSVTSTSTRVNKATVQEIKYRFEDARGAPHVGTSYGTSAPRKGQSAAVEYVRGSPEVSRLAGKQTGVFPLFALFPVSISGIVGLCMLIPGVLRGRRNVRLLRDGVPTTGRLVARRPTSTRINKQRVWELRFSFVTAEGRPCEAVARTHLVARLLDEAEEPLLYDPRDPTRAAMLDALPGNPRLDDAGRILGSHASVGVFVLPLLALTAWLAALVLVLVV